MYKNSVVLFKTKKNHKKNFIKQNKLIKYSLCVCRKKWKSRENKLK